MKMRVLSFFEIEERFKAIFMELENKSLDKDYIVQQGNALLFSTGVCVSQMKASNSENYPGKSKHIQILEEALSAMKFKINTSTIGYVLSKC